MKHYCLKLALVSTIFLCTNAQAQQQREFVQGFYLGAAVGPSWGSASWDGISQITAFNDQAAVQGITEYWIPDGETSAIQAAGKIMLGYQFVKKPLYLAAEMGILFSKNYVFDLDQMRSYSAKTIIGGFPQTIDASAQIHDTATLGDREFDLDLKTGWLFVEDKLLTYARAGLAVNDLTLKNKGVWSSTFMSVPPYNFPYTQTLTDSSQEKQTALGIRLGLGAEYLLSQNLGLSLDYVYTYYGNIDTKAEASFSSFDAHNIDPSISQYYSFYGVDAPEVTVSTQTVMLGLLYHW